MDSLHAFNEQQMVGQKLISPKYKEVHGLPYADPDCDNFTYFMSIHKKATARRNEVSSSKATNGGGEKFSPRTEAYHKTEQRSVKQKQFELNSGGTEFEDDSDLEAQPFVNPSGKTNVARYGLLGSQKLIYKKKRKLEQLSLGLPDEQNNPAEISEAESYSGYSSSEERGSGMNQTQKEALNKIDTMESSNFTSFTSESSNPLTYDFLHHPPDDTPVASSDHPRSDSDGNQTVVGVNIEGNNTDESGSSSQSDLENIDGHFDTRVSALPSQGGISYSKPSSSNPPVRASTPEAVSRNPKVAYKAALVLRESPRKLAALNRIEYTIHSDDDEDGQRDDNDEILPCFLSGMQQPILTTMASTQHENELNSAMIKESNGATGRIDEERNLKGDSTKPVEGQIPEGDHSSAVEGDPLPSTAPSQTETTIQVKQTPYTPSKAADLMRTVEDISPNRFQHKVNVDCISLDKFELIPATSPNSTTQSQMETYIGDKLEKPSSISENCIRSYQASPPANVWKRSHENESARSVGISLPSEALVAKPSGKRKQNYDQHLEDQGHQGKRPYVRKLGFSAEEVQHKDLGEVAREHKKRYLEGLNVSDEPFRQHSKSPGLFKDESRAVSQSAANACKPSGFRFLMYSTLIITVGMLGQTSWSSIE